MRREPGSPKNAASPSTLPSGLVKVCSASSPWGTGTAEKAYTYFDLQVLSASLGMLGVSLENNALYNRLLENHRQLVSANDNLKELDRLKSEFLRNINHELRTPLTVIIGYLTFLLEQEEENSQKVEFLHTIHDESLKLKGLVGKSSWTSRRCRKTTWGFRSRPGIWRS